jgi:alkylation response protein AidB-like acyl-CoA dehydrogenase
VVNLRQPGVTPKPIRQITGSRLFAEVFYDNAVVPEADRIGAEGQGWSIAMRTVSYERGPADIGYISRYRRMLARLEYAVARGKVRNAALAEQTIGELHVAIETLRLRVLQSLSDRVSAGFPQEESSVDKLLMVGVEQRLGRAAIDFSGTDALVGDDPEAAYDYLFSRSLSIMGGTSQIQKNIIATRILRLGEEENKAAKRQAANP